MQISTPEPVPGDVAWNSRNVALLGSEGCARLSGARVLVAGVGGVGGYAAEMLVRAGVGHITILDGDDVAPSNINRQIVALHSTVGMSKVAQYEERFHDINPDCEVVPLHRWIEPENVDELLGDEYDYVADCIDTVAPKVALLQRCVTKRVRVISSMGAGGRLDPAKVCYSDLWSTNEDGLARAVRNAFKRLGTRPRIPVVCSREAPRRGAIINMELRNKRSSYGTLATIPAIFGIYMANHIIRSITKI